MASWVQIANKAVRRLGVAPIQSLTEDSEAARQINGIYEMVRDDVLSRHPWNCALYRTSIAADSTAPTFGYDNAYTLPTDPYCLRVWRVGEEEYAPVEYRVEGRKIVTDEDAPLYVTYIKRITDPEEFSPWVANLLSAVLAEEIAYGLTNSTSKEEAMRQWAKDVWKEARAMDGQEGTPEEAIADDFLNSRF